MSADPRITRPTFRIRNLLHTFRFMCRATRSCRSPKLAI
jgi:hypothetical protein